MYSLKKTAKAFLAATKIKQSTNSIEIRTTVDEFLASLGANAIVVTDDIDPSLAKGIVIIDDDNPVESIVITNDDNPSNGGIVITDDDNPAEDIIITDDDNPLNAAIQELKHIAKAGERESLKIACGELIKKLERIIKAGSSLR